MLADPVERAATLPAVVAANAAAAQQRQGCVTRLLSGRRCPSTTAAINNQPLCGTAPNLPAHPVMTKSVGDGSHGSAAIYCLAVASRPPWTASRCGLAARSGSKRTYCARPPRSRRSTDLSRPASVAHQLVDHPAGMPPSSSQVAKVWRRSWAMQVKVREPWPLDGLAVLGTRPDHRGGPVDPAVVADRQPRPCTPWDTPWLPPGSGDRPAMRRAGREACSAFRSVVSVLVRSCAPQRLPSDLVTTVSLAQGPARPASWLPRRPRPP